MSRCAQALKKPLVCTFQKEVFDHEDTKPHFEANHCAIVFWGGDKPNEEFVEEPIATLPRHPGLDVWSGPRASSDQGRCTHGSRQTVRVQPQ